MQKTMGWVNYVRSDSIGVDVVTSTWHRAVWNISADIIDSLCTGRWTFCYNIHSPVTPIAVAVFFENEEDAIMVSLL